MAKLSYQSREKLSKKTFALPSKRTKTNKAGKGAYPIPDESHARAALSYGARFASPEELAQIKAKVRKKFPGIGKKKK